MNCVEARYRRWSVLVMGGAPLSVRVRRVTAPEPLIYCQQITGPATMRLNGRLPPYLGRTRSTRRKAHAAAHGHEASRGSSRGGRRGCGEFSPSVSPCLLPGLSCADTGRGGSSPRPKGSVEPSIFGGEDITVRVPPHCVDGAPTAA